MKAILFLTLLAVLSPLTNAFELTFPEQSEVSIVGADLYIKGKQVSIWEVKTSLPKQAHAEYYQQDWKLNGDDFGVVTLDKETIVSKQYDGVLYTAQVTQGYKQSIAIVSTSKAPTNKLLRIIAQVKELPSPTGSEVLNEIKAKDGAKYSTTLVLKNNRSVRRNVNFYTNYLNKHGFIVDREMVNPDGTEGVIIARLGPNEFNATFEKVKGQTYITAVRVDTDV